jgi:hypothetical protein
MADQKQTDSDNDSTSKKRKIDKQPFDKDSIVESVIAEVECYNERRRTEIITELAPNTVLLAAVKILDATVWHDKGGEYSQIFENLNINFKPYGRVVINGVAYRLKIEKE